MAVSSALPVSHCTGTTLMLIPMKPSVWIAPGAVTNAGRIGYEEGMSSSGMLFCSNSACGEKIIMDNRRQVLQPAGFVTDAHAPVTNNIETMKFVPVVPTPGSLLKQSPYRCLTR